MKTERRHELHSNWLADRLGEAAQSAQPYAKGLIGVLVAAALLLCTYLYLSHRAATEGTVGWDLVWQALNSRSESEQMDGLREVVEKYPSLPAGIWAQLLLADEELRDGVAVLLEERSVGMNHLHSALDGYESVEQKTTDPLVRQRALFGVGRAEESMNQLDKARKAYEDLANDYPDGPYAPRAKQRLEELARDSTKGLYDWLQTAEPPSHFGKGAGTPGSEKSGLPPEESPPPDQSRFPAGNPASVPPPEPKPDQRAPKPDATKSGEKKPGAAKPAETKSGESKSGNAEPAAKKAESPPAADGKNPPATKSPAPKSDAAK